MASVIAQSTKGTARGCLCPEFSSFCLNSPAPPVLQRQSFNRVLHLINIFGVILIGAAPVLHAIIELSLLYNLEYMEQKYITLTPELSTYITAHRSDTADAVLEELRIETGNLGDISGMQISPEQGTFLSLLVAAGGARTAIEVGTFTGYSAICIARGLPRDGKLICCDVSDEWTGIARKYWPRAGVEQKIDLRLGDAQSTLRALESDLEIDFAFIDADKTNYDNYYELILPRVRPNGLIIFDNMLWSGRVVTGPLDDPNIQAINALNHKLANDPRVESVLLPIADGLNICRKKSAS
jgi:caffeoyl-CoA O-methyltransferase